MKTPPLAALLLPLALAAPALADNPIIQTHYTADPAPMVHGDRLYVFTSHDEDATVRNFFTMNDWRCYSTADLVNWTDHGSPLAYTDFAWARGDAWAGQVVERDGKFYYYVPMNKKNAGNAIGVAVSDTPEGPYKDALGKPLIDSALGNIDPTPFIDTDGQAYLYWGNPALKYVKLNKDMTSYDQSIGARGIVTVPLTEESFGKRTGDAKRATLYEEGPWLLKRNDLYFMLFAASGIPENIAYSTAPSATGPWTYKGIIMPTEDRNLTKHRATSFTNHPGIVEFKGKNYFFYHNGALPGGGGFKRSVCVEEFKFNPDNSFPTIQMTDTGPAPIAHLDPFKDQQAATICFSKGVKTLPRAHGKKGVYVTTRTPDAYIKIASVDFGTKGAATFSATLATTAEGAAIELRLDTPTSDPIATLKVKPTGAPDQFQTQSTPTSNVKGIHDLYLKFTSPANTPPTNLDTWKFE